MSVKIHAPAKINFLLDILRTLPNGYHSLFMVMQSVSLYDEVTVGKADGVSLTCSEKSLPTDEKNLAFRAATAFFKATGIRGGAEIDIVKHIPLQAGLAGGSADAAAVLLALNELYGAGLTKDELCRLGVGLGADVPFCIRCGLMLAQDIGQILSPLPEIKDDLFIVLAKPESGVSTAAAYAAFDSARNLIHPDCVGALNAFASGRTREALDLCGNVFEQLVEVPERVEIKAVMRANGAIKCCMSGSGPTVFGVFDDKSSAEKCADKLRGRFADVFLTEPVNAPITETI